jgi:FtsP/CotA-like multicopper oxidase with cupredoxin domain
MSSRRDFMKWSLLAGGTTLAGLGMLKSTALAQSTDDNPIGQLPCPPLPQPIPGADPMPRPEGLINPSPATTPWAVALPIPPILQPVQSLVPPVNQAEHQLDKGFGSDPGPLNELYEMHIKPGMHSFHPELPPQEIWGYNGIVPGPTMIAHYGHPKIVRFNNQLPIDHVGLGVPETSAHNHNGHQESFSDGHPTTYQVSGQYRDHHYPIIYAGNDPLEALGTLWYHDHRADFTSQNVYRGLAGFHLYFDEVDSGNEHDTNPKALRLPSGEFDVPLMFTDKAFDSAGNLWFDPFNFDGFLGDKWCVNGKIQPYFKVARRKYRFRMLDGGPSRFYELGLSDGSMMTLIATDGNLMPGPVELPHIGLGPAQRRDVIIDFSKYPIGTEIILENALEQRDGRKPTGNHLHPGSPVLKFIVDRDPAEPDMSQVPMSLRQMPVMELATAQQHQRAFKFDRKNGAWAINGLFYDGEIPTFTIKQGQPEIWTLSNGGGGWAHPIHIHLEEFRILLRNGEIPGIEEQGRHDVVVLEPGDEVKIYIRFRTFTGKYVMHCHNTLHEDHAMMLRFDVVP